MLIDDFKQRFPELLAYADRWIPVLECEYQCYYGVSYDSGSATDKSAILALLAHLIWFNTQDTDGESVKVVNSSSVGGVSASFGAATSKTGDFYDFYSLSKYGQLFIMITRRNNGAEWV